MLYAWQTLIPRVWKRAWEVPILGHSQDPEWRPNTKHHTERHAKQVRPHPIEETWLQPLTHFPPLDLIGRQPTQGMSDLLKTILIMHII